VVADSGDKADLIRARLTRSPFSNFLGAELLEVGEGRCRLRLVIRRELTRTIGGAHGGVLAALADLALVLSLVSLYDSQEIESGAGGSTIHFSINYLAPAVDNEVYAEGRILRKGGSTATAEVDITDGQGALLAKAVGTIMQRRPRK
jgi:uncharacterized protein (TIGR00369 family)